MVVLFTTMSYTIGFSQQCTTGCTSSFSTSSTATVTLAPGETLCITGGTYTGTINFNAASGVRYICVGVNGIFNPTSINNSNNPFIINNYGLSDLGISTTLVSGSEINNYGTIRFRQNPNNSNTNFRNGTNASMQFDQGFSLGNGSSVTNDGYLTSLAAFDLQNGSVTVNNNRMRAQANITTNGTTTNNGIMTTQAAFNINGGTFINNCRLVALQGFNNSSSTTENRGLVWVPGGANSSDEKKLNFNGAIKNTGYMRAPRLSNSSTITNTSGAIRIEGGSNSNESQSNGIITGGTIGDIFNAALTPNYRLDVQGTQNGVTLANVPAYDTLSTQYSGGCNATYIGPASYAVDGFVYLDANGLTDNTVNGTLIAQASSQQLYLNVLNGSNIVVATTAVNTVSPNVGKFSLATVPSGTYTLQLSTVQGTVSSAAPAGSLPAGWVFTGEYPGTGTGSDGTADGRLSVTIAAATSNINFGIEQIPVGADYTTTSQNNPGSNNTILVPATAFTGTDAEDGSHPAGLTGRKLRLHPATNGTLYYNGIAVLVATDFPGFDPALVRLDPIDGGSITSSFNYQVYDNANFPSLVKTISLPFLQTTVTLSLKVLLQGGVIGNGAGFESTMRDNLRSSPFPDVIGTRYIPNSDPYSTDVEYSDLYTKVGDGTNPTLQTVVNPGSMFNSRGTSSAVDWIFIELRDKNNPVTVLATRSAIVQRDGTVVDIDGSSCIRFPSLPIDNYYVAVRHRNHLGAMTATAIPAATLNCSSPVDFTTMTDAQLWNNAGYDGLEQAILDDGKRALWAGNANGDNKVKYQGGTNDRTLIQSEVVNFPANTTLNINYDQAYGYFKGDINMDSKAKYQGSGNDRTILQSLVLGYLLNTTLNINYDLFLQQLP